MDMKKISKIPQCGRFPEMTGRKVVVGAKQLRKALENDREEYVFLAENADPALTEPIEEMCRSANIQVHWVRSKEDLGSACGIEVGAAAAAVLKS